MLDYIFSPKLKRLITSETPYTDIDKLKGTCKKSLKLP
jgi:hypothetical protein